MLNHSGSKILKTERLTLRPFRVNDAEDMFRNWAGDSEVTKFLTWTPHKNVDETRALLAAWEEEAQRPDVYHWAIECGGMLVGDISVVEVNERAESACVGYCLSRKYWGRGIMSEAFRAVLSYLFGEVKFNRVYSSHSAENPASGKVMEKCGLLYEGTFREEFRLLSTNELTDIIHRAVLREEWLEKFGG